MAKFVDQLLSKASEMKENQVVTIPITRGLLTSILRRKEKFEHVDVTFKDGLVEVTGKIRIKTLLPLLPFKVVLQPMECKGRVITFKLIKLRPVNNDFIIKRVLSSAYVSYDKKIVSIDLNRVHGVKKLPLGTVKYIQIKNNKMYVVLGV